MGNCSRDYAIEKIAEYSEKLQSIEQFRQPEEYGKYVFNEAAIKQYLPKKVADKLLATIRDRQPLDPSIADDVANAMKEWAISLGATHFTHWFQPLTGGTAEKHDAFLDISPTGEALMTFSGKNLIKGEPDASSLPSGGLRCTFEARGYTAWDPTSPAFIRRHQNGATLCIPTIFCSYTGDVLDKKTPLLRSISALEKSVKRLMKAFGCGEEAVCVTLGAEQEYFLVDRNFYLHRPDLVQTGRTLFGSAPPRHQQLEDHYFGSIRPRILAFMTDLDQELWRLGIPAKTRHNEVAPAQFEVAPIFEELNLAVDHNMLTMDVLRRVALRHGMVCLLHEKPFAGINGSGKHNNWALSYGGRNLLEPGDDPQQNAVFLTVLTAIIRAVDLHSDILRASTVSAGNKHRLGGNEAPPSIISIFLGEQLTAILEQIGQKTSEGGPMNQKQEVIRLGGEVLPLLPKDSTDRNRTSPFAFTGNKFEFRACGSSQSCAGFNMTMNTIVAESLDFISEQLEKLSPGDSESFHSGLEDILARILHDHKRIVFNGNNYSPEWVEEAKKRGLPILQKSMDALRTLLKEENQELFERYGVFTHTELSSRFEVFLEEYHSRIRIEGGIALEMAQNIILPIILREYDSALSILTRMKTAGLTEGAEGTRSVAAELGSLVDELTRACKDLEEALGKQHEDILENMRIVRAIVDRAEKVVSDDAWPLPKYREMLFIYN
ncbi:MAG: glutamine synthetase III [Thermoguttaceae bacterium]|nr:glutamine synthetase III [Thermoguttaceae bacterium]